MGWFVIVNWFTMYSIKIAGYQEPTTPIRATATPAMYINYKDIGLMKQKTFREFSKGFYFALVLSSMRYLPVLSGTR